MNSPLVYLSFSFFIMYVQTSHVGRDEQLTVTVTVTAVKSFYRLTGKSANFTSKFTVKCQQLGTRFFNVILSNFCFGAKKS